ncbi:MAG: hypothetical protein KIT19_10260 [Phycisphaeraceae bacterium]|nr:hypothetical protein [Phycisphaeraceae bacterium]
MQPVLRSTVMSVVLSLIGGTAMSDVHTVLDPEQRIITRNEFMFDLFNPTELVLTPYVPGGGPFSQSPNSMRLGFEEFAGAPTATITGNILIPFPPTPFASPSLLGGIDALLQNGTWLDATRIWVDPDYDPDSGVIQPASLGQLGDQGDFDILSFTGSEMVYIGYARSDKSMFGYVQMQRVTTYDWKLIGYRFDDSGAPLFIEPLVVPGSATLLAIGTAGLLAGRQRRR